MAAAALICLWLTLPVSRNRTHSVLARLSASPLAANSAKGLPNVQKKYWPESVIAAYRRIVLPLVSETTRGYLEKLLRHGFAMYVYYFPRSPERVRHFTQGDGALGLPEE